jgi:transposase
MKPEIKILEDFIRDNPDPRELKRALAVKLALSGYAYRAIQEIVGITAGFITKWKQQFLSQGLRGIFLKNQGSKSYLTRKDREKILRWIINQKHWNVWEVETYILETYEVIFKSKQSYYKLLKEARISWQKGEKENPKQNSEEIERKNQEIASILKNKKEEIEAGKLVVYAIDECHLLWGDLIGYLWNFIKESPKEGRKIEEMPERIKVMIGNEKERQTYYGALNLGNPELVLESYSAGNGENTVDFLGRLQGKHIGAKLLIIWDGASYHRGEELNHYALKVHRFLKG